MKDTLKKKIDVDFIAVVMAFVAVGLIAVIAQPSGRGLGRER